MRKICFFWLLIVSFLAAGCSSNPDERQALSGTIRLRGEVLDQGAVKFLPTTPEQKYGTGAMIQNGKFDISPEFGLTPGVYKVMIMSQEPDDKNAPPPAAKEPGATPPPIMRERIPPEYNSHSTLTIEVKNGRQTNQLNIDIK
jgi:hypothetical protein